LILNVPYATLTAVSDKGWVGWATENRLLVGAIALVTAVSLTIVAVVAGHSGSSTKKRVASNSKVEAGTSVEPGGSTTESTLTGGTVLPGASAAAGTGSKSGGITTPTTAAGVNVPGVTVPGGVSLPACAPKAGFKSTGLDQGSVSIGQIVTDNNALPAQLKPNKEGLDAYIRLVNAAGGVCGRKINIVYRNDNLNPATHDYQGLARQVFAFVANSSLLDSNDYDNTPPFNPKYTDNGQFVPDVGGLAYAYSRSQSQWHAGTVGSISPTLVGGLGFKLYAERAKLDGGACKKGAIMYLTEPTGASKDSAFVGDVAVRGDWGANLGNGNTKLYVENLAQPELVYEQEVQKMMTDGMNCVFTYMDLGSNVALVQAMAAKGVWPPDKCKLGPKCFRLVGVPFSAYDPKFIHDGGEGARFATTFLPHVPLNETSSPQMQTYLNALKKYEPGATPSTFSLIGWGAGQMFVEALGACGTAPTRNCVMDHLRALKGFTAGGLISGTTPFQSTKATCGDCGSSISWKGTFAWKWIFNCIVVMQVQDRGGVRDFYRTTPEKGYVCGPLRVARGSPA
jgi:branched-chain amino acid transport system substrate-binding protein